MSTQFLISSFSFSFGHIVFYFSSNILFLSFIFQLPFCFSYVCFLFLYLVILFILPFHIRTNPNLSFFGIHCHLRTVFYRILFSENHHLTQQHNIWYAPFFFLWLIGVSAIPPVTIWQLAGTKAGIPLKKTIIISLLFIFLSSCRFFRFLLYLTIFSF